MKLMYLLLQYTVFILSIQFGIMRYFDEDFPLMIFLNSIGLTIAVLVLLLTTKFKIENDPKHTFVGETKKKVIIILHLSLLVVLLLSSLIASLSIYNEINTDFADMFSIFALGISLANDSLSDMLFGLIAWSNKKFNKKNRTRNSHTNLGA